MNTFWDERFSAEKYVYGTEPNLFYKEQLEKLAPGKIVFPAEGEGRNAVYAAEKGWDVVAFDSSIEGKKKAVKLAAEKGVNIDYIINNYENIYFEPHSFDCIVLIFAHMHPFKRTEYHQKLISFLRPGGAIILEGFSKKQINNKTGGPPNIDMLFSKEELQNDFKFLQEHEIWETDVVLNEGLFHQGTASVIRLTGKK
ncbi:MAG: class I SAM-dependent methyltransferase [Prolixibacteraceae bacterium]